MKKSVFAAAALMAALSFNAAAAGEPAPVISAERWKSIRACMDKIDNLIRQHDTRAPGNNMERYYYNNDAHMVAIKTAVQTGKYEAELDRLNLLGQLQSLTAFSLSMHSDFHCAVLADENGDIDEQGEGRGLVRHYVEMTESLVRYSNEMMTIVRQLKDEGDRLIAAGSKPADRDAHVFLFR